MAERNQKDWRELCTAVVNETDSNKLSSLVQKLVEALDENRRPRTDPCGENLEPPESESFASDPGNSLTRSSGMRIR
jgi:hypothetical protein